MEGLRRAYGLGEPIRRGMELKIAMDGEWMPRILGGGSSIHADVLAGRDCEIGWEDVFRGMYLVELNLRTCLLTALLQVMSCARCPISTPRWRQGLG